MGETGSQEGLGRIGRTFNRARRPNKAAIESLRLRAPFWWVFAFLFTFAAYQIWMNPFGFSDLTQRYTQDIANLLITGPYLYPREGHDEISVALVDDQALDTLQMPWPWHYGAQARVLDALLADHPRAVIVDLLFADPRTDDTLSELTDEIGRYKKAGVPLYFVGATDLPPGTPPVRHELIAAGARILDPTTIVNQGVVRQYPVTGRCMNGEAPGTPCRSLALTVYHDLFPKRPLDLNPAGRMEIVWGTKTDPTNAKWMHVEGADGKLEPCGRRIGMLRRIYLAFFDPAEVRSHCPYEGVIPVTALLSGRPDADVSHLTRGHIVFYGASLEGVQDRSFTPVNGMIASVFVHAMALDNLITFAGKPEQNVLTIAGVTLDNNPIQIGAIIPVILILAWIHIRNLRARERKRANASGDNPHSESGAMFEFLLDKAMELVWHWGAFALALAAGLALTMAAGLSVANWVEVVFVSVELAAMLLVGVPDALWGYLHHVTGGEAPAAERQEEKPA